MSVQKVHATAKSAPPPAVCPYMEKGASIKPEYSHQEEEDCLRNEMLVMVACPNFSNGITHSFVLRSIYRRYNMSVQLVDFNATMLERCRVMLAECMYVGQ